MSEFLARCLRVGWEGAACAHAYVLACSGSFLAPGLAEACVGGRPAWRGAQVWSVCVLRAGSAGTSSVCSLCSAGRPPYVRVFSGEVLGAGWYPRRLREQGSTPRDLSCAVSPAAGVQEKMGIMNKGVIYALWDYEPQNEDELPMKEGDCMTVLRREDEDEVEWWWARLNEKEGYVPRNLLGVSHPDTGEVWRGAWGNPGMLGDMECKMLMVQI